MCDLVEASPVRDVGFAMIAEPHPSCFQSIKPLPQQEGDEGTIVLDASAQKLILEDAPHVQNKRLTLGTENANTDIHFVNKTCKASTSETEKNLEEDISFESLTKHFGRSLDDAAKSFGGKSFSTMFLHFHVSVSIEHQLVVYISISVFYQCSIFQLVDPR